MGTQEEVAYVEHPLVTAGTIERRLYQVQLAATAGADHTLVCLPTGLGKTAVSLLVTASRLREHGGKALLLAPTKPLVTQHAEDYREWLTLPREEVVVFTGEVRPDDRADRWDDATVIVATPQVIENDLIGGRIGLEDVVHLTFDECHRATGDYAYTYIAERYHADAESPLMTGLSASPGGDAESIREVCENLGIRKVEVMTADDADVARFAHDTDVEWKHVTLPDEVLEIRDALNEVIRDRLSTLQELGVTRSSDPNLSEGDLRKLRGQLQELIDNGRSSGYKGMSLHAEIRKLKTAVTYIETQSVESFRRYLDRQEQAARSSSASKATQRMMADPRVHEAKRRAERYDDLHPKFRRARILIAETLGINDGQRVIVFTESRDTAETLTAFLGGHFETRKFVGQADRDGSDGMTQTEQQETLDAFRAGDFSVLVSTSVAEEGLDVPEVDLVLFYEPVPTAIRSIQRKGRTGRQTEGRVVVLIAEDTRDEAYFWISRNREKKMREELRSLKEIAAAVSDQLDQSGLDSFDGPRDEGSPSTGDAGATDGTGEAETEPASGDGDAGPSTGSATRADTGQSGLSAFAADRNAGSGAAPEPAERGDAPSPAPGESAVEIVVDQRELDTAIARELSKRDGVEVRLETLDVGDYVLSDRVAVERKSIADFLASLTGDDRSVFEQVRDLTRHYPRPVVLIEGEGSLYGKRNVHPNAIRGALASLAVDFGVSVLRSENDGDTADILEVIARREQESGGREARVHGEKTQKTLAEQQEYVVSSIAEVGPVTARSLLSAFGSVEAIMTVDEEQLREVDGIGTVTASRIREVVASEYHPE